MIERIQFPRSIPEGHREISVELDAGFSSGPLRVEGTIPDDEFYPSEIKRLSRKVLRNYPYTEPVWNDAAGTVLKKREATETVAMPWLGASGDITLREIHDANLPPDQSLLELQLITINDTGEEVDGHPIYPTEYISYDLDADGLLRWRIEDYHETMDPVAVQTAVEESRVVGEDRERLILYARLRFLAGE